MQENNCSLKREMDYLVDYSQNFNAPFPSPELFTSSSAAKIIEEAFKSRAYYLKKIKGLEKNLFNLRKDARRRQATIWKRNQQIKSFESNRKKERYTLILSNEKKLNAINKELEKEKALRMRMQAFDSLSSKEHLLLMFVFASLGSFFTLLTLLLYK